MKLFHDWRKRRAIKSYRTRLPLALRKDYGRSDTYLPAQVVATIVRHAFDRSHLLYALALCCTPEAIAAYCAEQGVDADYHDLRDVVGAIVASLGPRYASADLSVHGPAWYGNVGGFSGGGRGGAGDAGGAGD